MAKPFDAILKQILDDYAADWMAWLVPGIVRPGEVLEAIDPKLSTVQPTADKVFRLPGNAGLIHLELQSTWGGSLPDRMLLYNALLYDRYGGPVDSFAILLRQDAEANALTGLLKRRLADGVEYFRFAYKVVRVWEYPADTLLSSGLGIAPLGLLTDDAVTRLAELVPKLADRVKREIPDVGMQDRFLSGSYLLLGLRYDECEIESVFRGVQEMEESSTYRALINKGLNRGLVLGRDEGRTEGLIAGLRLSIVTLLEQKFGSVPNEMLSKIQMTTDAAKLENAIRQTVTIQSVVELTL